MKTIKAGDLTLPAFEIADLKDKAREKVLIEHYTFLAETNEYENESGEMVVEELEYDENMIVENIEMNGYLFDFQGNILPVTQYVGKHPKTGTYSLKVFGEEVPCSIL